MHIHLMRPRARIATLGAALVVLGGVACSALSSAPPPAPTTSPSNLKSGQPAIPAAIPAAAPAGGGVAVGAPAPAVASDAAAQRSAVAANSAASANALPDTSAQILDRMVIRTAQLTVEVPSDIESALAQARQIATRGGGYVSASNTHVERVNDQDRMVADLTLQVRSDAADSTLSDLRGLGKVTSETSGSQDITEEYVDLTSNLRNLQASETAILKLMDKAGQIQDVLALQRELTNVRGQIERIQGRKTYLERRSDMATITLALRLPAPEATRTSGGWDPIAVAARGWQASLAVLRGAAEALIVVVAFSWWLIPFVALGANVWLRRRRPAPATAPTPNGPASSGPAPAQA